MPYSEDFAGIYVLRNDATGNGYVGQSSRMRKRVADHFNLLRRGCHPNQHLQRAFSKYGEAVFSYDFEVICEDHSDLNMLEDAYLTGDAAFDDTAVYYNISRSADAPMRGRTHTEETKAKIRETKRGQVAHITPEYRRALSAGQLRRVLSKPGYVAKIKFVVNNPHLSYAERGRVVGFATSTARKVALKYTPIKETLNGQH